MTTSIKSVEDLLLDITQEIHVKASLDKTFEAMLEQLGPYNETPDGKPLAMKLEPWPGGRWFRDLGNSNGHYWATVQAIKRPTLLEFSGPLFASSPFLSNVQYRLTEETRRHSHHVPAYRARPAQRRSAQRRLPRMDVHEFPGQGPGRVLDSEFVRSAVGVQ